MTPTLTSVFDNLAGRFMARKQSALDVIDGAAKTLAAGGTIDAGAVEQALVAAGLDLDAFRERVEFQTARREKLEALEKLGAARRRVEQLDGQLAAEAAKHAEVTAAFHKRYAALRDEATNHQREVDRARDAREWILDPKNCPLALREPYEAALAAVQAARENVSTIGRQLRDLRERHRGAEAAIAEIVAADARELHPPQAIVAASQKERLAAATREKVEQHERRRDRLAREVGDAEQELAAAEQAVVRAEAAIAELVKRILTA